MAAAAGLPLPRWPPSCSAASPRQAATRWRPGQRQPLTCEAAAAGWSLRDLLAAAAADRARDGAELVGALADQVLAPLGAVALAVWLLAADGALEMLGERGLGGMAATRWRRLPPDFDCPPQRFLRDGAELWWHAGPPPGDPVVMAARWGSDAARAVLGLRRRNGALLGVLQVWWPRPLPSFTAETRLRAVRAGRRVRGRPGHPAGPWRAAAVARGSVGLHAA